MRPLYLLLTVIALCWSQALFAQNPVSWSFSAKHLQGDEYELYFKASIGSGWYIYSQFLNGDGPVPTSINFDTKHQQLVGKASETTSASGNKKSGYDDMFDMQIVKYKSDLLLTQKVRVKDISKPVKGYVEFMTCNDEKCLPPTSPEFSIDLSKVALAEAKAPEVDPKKNTVEPNPPSKTDKKETTNPDKANVVEPTPTENPEKGGGVLEPVKWTFSLEKINDQEYEVVLKASIEKGWHIYSQFIGEGGPEPTAIVLNLDKHFELVGKSSETTSKATNRQEGMDKVFNMKLIKFQNDYTATQRIKVSDTTKAIKGYVSFMVCDKEKCLPPTMVEFSFFEEAPVVTEGPVAEGIVRPRLQETLKTASTSGDCGTKTPTNDLSLWMIFIFGFLGGLFALLTPCVFPMVPLTVSYFTKRSRSKAEGIKNGLIYGGSIIVIYVVLGMLVTVLLGDNALNWLSTHWIPNTLFFILFIAFAISFFGYYDIKLPSSWSNTSDRAADRGGLLGIFFMAFTLSLVSFSCTGPIIGTLLVEASEGGRIAPMIGMLGFSAALALPFGLFSAFPGWLQSLPKSGGWMNTVKVVLGFVEFALAFKFLSKADLTMHWGILKYETFLVIMVLCALGMGLYLFGFIRFPHDDKGAKIGIPRKIFAVLSIALAAYFGLGFSTNELTHTYATPPLMSGIAPPACYSYFRPCDCPAGIQNCFHDYETGLAYAKSVNKPVMIDFTGYGCENCRKMEDQVWVDKDVNKILNDEYVLISLYVDDREKLPEVYIAPDGQKIRNVGNKWAAFERINFNQISQPLYVLMSPDETVLNAPSEANFVVKDYKEFLECGLSNFAKMNKK